LQKYLKADERQIRDVIIFLTIRVIEDPPAIVLSFLKFEVENAWGENLRLPPS
jgi:hypothetical protein